VEGECDGREGESVKRKEIRRREMSDREGD